MEAQERLEPEGHPNRRLSPEEEHTGAQEHQERLELEGNPNRQLLLEEEHTEMEVGLFCPSRPAEEGFVTFLERLNLRRIKEQY